MNYIRKLYRVVHPDLFHASPKDQQVNKKGLQDLHHIIDLAKGEQKPSQSKMKLNFVVALKDTHEVIHSSFDSHNSNLFSFQGVYLGPDETTFNISTDITIPPGALPSKRQKLLGMAVSLALRISY